MVFIYINFHQSITIIQPHSITSIQPHIQSSTLNHIIHSYLLFSSLSSWINLLNNYNQDNRQISELDSNQNKSETPRDIPDINAQMISIHNI